jgi:hypothetical protein
MPARNEQDQLNAWVRAFTALARVTRRVRITSTIPDLVFRGCGRGLTEHRSGDLFGVEPVGFAVHVPGHRLGRFTSTIRSPALLSALVKVAPNEPVLSTDRQDLALALHPSEEALIAALVGWELAVAQQPA